MREESPRKPKYFDTETSTEEVAHITRRQITKRQITKLRRPEFDRPVECHKRTCWEGIMRQRQSFAIILIGKSILLREGLARILRSASFRILASVSCADDLVPSKLQVHQPLFLVIHTGDDCDAAVEQVKLFRNQYPGGRIAIVADHYRLSELVSAFRAGTNGYFVDVMACDVFIKSIELVMMAETIFPPAFLSFVLVSEGDPRGEAAPREEHNQAPL